MIKRIIVVGDVHGCLAELKNLVRRVRFNPAEDKLVFVGDYIDRGRDGCGVIQYVRSLQAQSDNVVALMGNHEDMMIGALTSGDNTLWDVNGGEMTRKSYRAHGLALDAHFGWLTSLPLYFYDKDFNLVVAHGAYPGDNFDADKNVVLWDRKWIDTNTRPFTHHFIFGHTPDYCIRYTANGSLCIDSCCFYTGRLSCAEVRKMNGSTVITPITFEMGEDI